MISVDKYIFKSIWTDYLKISVIYSFDSIKCMFVEFSTVILNIFFAWFPIEWQLTYAEINTIRKTLFKII